MTDSPDPDPTQSNELPVPKPSVFIRPSEASGAALSPGRVEANSAFLKIGQNPGDLSGFEVAPLIEGQSGITPSDDEDGGEAASARIAQEYRRQVRIKRLAEEIQQAERAKKKEEEQRRKSEFVQRQTGSFKKKDETARVDMDSGLAVPADSEDTLAKRRAAAMYAFKSSSGRNSRGGLVFFLCSLALMGLAAGGAWIYLNGLAAQREVALREEQASRLQAMLVAEKKAEQDAQNLQAREAELQRQKNQFEVAAKKAEDERLEKLALDEQTRRKEAEHQKVVEEETARRVAEERRLQEENQRLIEKANRDRDELRKKVEESQRIVREKLKKDQDDDAAKTEEAARAKAAAISADVAKADSPKTNPAKNETKPNTPLTGEVKTIPSDPAAVPWRMELPSGGVRLMVKASDPYGGTLSFQWRQLRGVQVDIADPEASKFLDGKWISQTYFVAREPGDYEFEVTVKNEDGVETRKKFPIEVLPPTTLK